MTKQELMRRAIALAVENVKQGGGPFGAVIARNGEIVAEGVNRVTFNTTLPPMPRCKPFAMLAPNWALSTSAAATFTHRANRAPCVWGPSIGHTSATYTLLAQKLTLPRPDLTTPLYTRNCHCPSANATCPPKPWCTTRPMPLSTPGVWMATKWHTEWLIKDIYFRNSNIQLLWRKSTFIWQRFVVDLTLYSHLSEHSRKWYLVFYLDWLINRIFM